MVENLHQKCNNSRDTTEVMVTNIEPIQCDIIIRWGENSEQFT